MKLRESAYVTVLLWPLFEAPPMRSLDPAVLIPVLAAVYLLAIYGLLMLMQRHPLRRP
jgi:hypothetical protein